MYKDISQTSKKLHISFFNSSWAIIYITLADDIDYKILPFDRTPCVVPSVVGTGAAIHVSNIIASSPYGQVEFESMNRRIVLLVVMVLDRQELSAAEGIHRILDSQELSAVVLVEEGTLDRQVDKEQTVGTGK